MKLDTRAIRYLSSEDWRVLHAVEQGSKNHELVPTPLIQSLSGQRSGVHKCISALAKVGLIAKVKNAKYDGYRLTYGGLDYLALNTHRRANTIYSLGNQIGVGKESDIYVTASPEGRQQVLKIHRLGRISFRTVKSNRDYLRNNHNASGSWMHLSTLAASKEYAFMRVLHREGFPVPEPISVSRHTVVMEFIDAFPLRMIESVPDPASLYAELMDLIVRFASRGLIHGDYNEFNILVKEITQAPEPSQQDPRKDENENGSQDTEPATKNIRLEPIVIDFPQTLSTSHQNAQMYFDRDVACIKRFFERRFGFTSDEPGPFFKDVKLEEGAGRLDVEVEATGFSRKLAKELDRYIETVGGNTNEAENYDGDADGGQADEDVAEEDKDDLPQEIPSDPQVDDPQLAEELGSFTVEDDLAVKPTDGADFGLMPLDLPQDPDQVAEKVKTRKKAAGWAI